MYFYRPTRNDGQDPNKHIGVYNKTVIEVFLIFVFVKNLKLTFSNDIIVY